MNLTTKRPFLPALEPTTVTQAMKDHPSLKGMDVEFNALLHNGTWELAPKSTHVPISCK